MTRGFLLLLMSIAACVSTAALAHGNVGVYVGAPGPVYAAPPPIFYRNFWAPAYQAYPPPVVYQSPPRCVWTATGSVWLGWIRRRLESRAARQWLAQGRGTSSSRGR